jgi:hypothetical protein
LNFQDDRVGFLSFQFLTSLKFEESVIAHIGDLARGVESTLMIAARFAISDLSNSFNEIEV